MTFAARACCAPINREVNGVPQVLHFGASVRTREAGDDQPFFQYGPNARGADLHLANAPINTGRIGDEDTFWGLEAAGLWGPFSIQGEYAQLDVDLPGGALIRNNGSAGTPSALNPFIGVPDPDFTGWYVEGSWFFGGHKTYEDEGRWGRPKVNNPMFHGSGGWGGLQIVGKYDVLEMGDTGNARPCGIPRGRSQPEFRRRMRNDHALPGRKRNGHFGRHATPTRHCRVRRHEDLDRRRELVDDRVYAPDVPVLAIGSERLSDHAATAATGTNLRRSKERL